MKKWQSAGALPEVPGPADEVAPGSYPDAVGGVEDPPAPRRTRRARTAVVSGLAALVLLTVALAIPVPYVAQQPGPTFDTLASLDDTPMVSVEGAEVYPTEGELRLTTVAVMGGPGHRMNSAGLLATWFDRNSVVVPLEQYYPPAASQEEIEEHSNLEMQSSQTDAAVAALEELGMAVPTTLTVSYTDPASGAEGVVRPDDVLRAITVDGQRTELVDFATLSRVLAATAPGTDVTLTVDRDGEEVDLTFPTGSRDARDAAVGLPLGDEPDGSVLGLGLTPDADLPVDVTYQIDDVGGPSAGMMFALATVDLLTPGAMTGGEPIAGTGTISLDGAVGPIGGIRQKVVGARDDGAEFFLVPQANCEELAGHVPDGLRDIEVRRLSDAREAVEVIGSGDAAAIDALPSCGG